MRYLIVFSGFLVFSSSAFSHSDCVDRVIQAQQRLAPMVGELSPAQQAEMSAVLMDLCTPRDAGASVVREPGRTSYTTHGLNEGPHIEPAQDTPVIIGVEVDRPRHYPGGHRPGREWQPPKSE